MSRATFLILMLLTGAAVLASDLPATISVNGQGTARTMPDRATVTLSIVARHQGVSGAQQEAGEVAARVLALAADLDIPENRVDTMSASVYPDYRWNPTREEQELRGYVAQREMRIELHDLEKVGVIVERAVEQGVNQVSPPQLTSSRQREAYREALDAAVEDARANAERLAAALGVTLGPAIQASAGAPFRPPMPMMGARQADVALAAQALPETFNAGERTIRANVTVVYEIGE